MRSIWQIIGKCRAINLIPLIAIKLSWLEANELAEKKGADSIYLKFYIRLNQLTKVIQFQKQARIICVIVPNLRLKAHYQKSLDLREFY